MVQALTPVCLPSTLTLLEASDVLVRFTPAVSQHATSGSVRLDGSALVKFDSSALAVLLEWRRTALALGSTFAVDGLPVALQGLAEVYGVAVLMEDSVAPV